MFGVLNYVFVAVTKFESLKFSMAQGKWKLIMSAPRYGRFNWVPMGARCYSFIYQPIISSNSKLLVHK